MIAIMIIMSAICKCVWDELYVPYGWVL